MGSPNLSFIPNLYGANAARYNILFDVLVEELSVLSVNYGRYFQYQLSPQICLERAYGPLIVNYSSARTRLHIESVITGTAIKAFLKKTKLFPVKLIS